MKLPGKPNSRSRPKAPARPGPADLSEDRCFMAQLRQIQKVRVFGAFAGGVAHDFNNLLTIFHGYTEILQMSIATGDPRQAYLGEMAAAVERARALTTQILDFNRKKPDVPAPLSLGTFLLGFHKMMRRIAGEEIESNVRAEDGKGWAVIAPGAVESLLLNLVANACEAMPRGGRLSLELDEIELPPSDRRVQAGWKPGPYVRISVGDTGAGISKGALKRIFQPGFTTHAEREAPGVGLPLCTAIAEENGGKLTAESAEGKGSVFRLFLPRIAPPAREEPPAAARKAPAAFGNGKKVLVVEDDAPVNRTLAAMVRQLGFQPLCAANGEEALRTLESTPEIRLLVADLVMPLMGGAALAAAVRERWPQLGILLISGYILEPPEPPIFQGSTPLFLPKPLAIGALARKLRELLNV